MIILALLLLDITLFHIFQQVTFSFLLCYYFNHLLQHKVIVWKYLITVIALFMLSTFLFHGTFGIDILYLLPLTLIGCIMRYFLHYRIWQIYILSFSSIYIQELLLHTSYALFYPFSIWYTISKCCVILGLITLFSLIYQQYGAQGNRL